MPPLDLEIKAAALSDIDTLRIFARENFRMTYAHLNTPENMNAYLENTFSHETFIQEYEHPDSEFYIGTQQDRLVAYYKLNFGQAQSEPDYPNSAEIARIYVHPRYKGRGIGKEMVHHARAISARKGLEYLWLGVWEKNPAALSFYEKVGFRAVGDHVFQLGEDAQRDIIMKMKVTPDN